MSHQRKIYVVGRGLEMRRMLTDHVSAIGAEAWPFASAADFLEILDHLAPACVLLDMDLEEPPGIEVLEELRARAGGWPVIAICAREEFHLAIRAMKLGALDFLALPIRRDKLAEALAPAWKALERAVAASGAKREAQERIARFTAREIDVLLALLGGRANKAIAHDFGISVRTVEMHRAHLTAKLEVRSLAEAAMLAAQAGVDPAKTAPPPRRPGPAARPPPPADLVELARRLSH